MVRIETVKGMKLLCNLQIVASASIPGSSCEITRNTELRYILYVAREP